MEPADPNYFGEVAKRYIYRDNGVEVGFITSVSESFCSTCTSSSLSANGKIFTCLFNGNGHDIRDFMRNGASDDEIRERIINIWNRRTDRYSEIRTAETAFKGKKLRCRI